MKTLFPFQITGRDFLMSRRSALLADDMGLGKTVQAIEAAKGLGITSGLIVCPLSVRHTWAKVLRVQYPNVFINEVCDSRAHLDRGSFNIVNYDIAWRGSVGAQLKTLRWPLLIADESHFMKDISAKRTKAILGRNGVASRCTYRWLLTGTPVLNRPIELYPILRSLAPNLLGGFSDYYKYAFKFCAAYKDSYGFNVSGASNLSLLSGIVSKFMLRRMKSEVLEQMPSVIFEKIYLSPTQELMRNTEQERLVADVKSIRRALGILKIAPAISHLDDLLTVKNKVVVYTYHTAVAQALKDHFKDNAVMYTGAETAKEKEICKAQFIQDDKVKIFIGQIMASGTGLDGLQDVCDHVVFVELVGVPGQIQQCIDRVNRIGQKHPVCAQFLIVESSIDEHTVDTLANKNKVIKTILKEEGGKDYAVIECRVCGGRFGLNKIRKAGGLTVCRKCEKVVDCLI